MVVCPGWLCHEEHTNRRRLFVQPCKGNGSQRSFSEVEHVEDGAGGIGRASSQAFDPGLSG